MRALALLALAAALPASAAQAPSAPAIEVDRGERLEPSAFGYAFVETIEEALERDRSRPLGEPENPKARNGRPGRWVVPSRRASVTPRSGRFYATNQWGDLRMGIGFPEPVDVVGLWVFGQESPGVWPPALRAVGYRDGIATAESAWLEGVSAEPRWLALDFEKVDRIVLEARPAVVGAAFYGIDDLTYVVREESGPREIVVDFEDTDYRFVLTGSGYGGLSWEEGDGSGLDQGVHAPLRPPGAEIDEVERESTALALGGGGTAPTLVNDFEAIRMGQHSSSSYPPDTCGAVGSTQFVEVVNRVFAVYDKASGVKLVGMNLGSFLPGSNGDPRVHWDPFANRWVVMATNFQNRLYVAVSRTADATGSWFKTNFNISQGSDSGCWPDYPTMGLDENGYYFSAYMVGCNSMSIFAVEKAPMIANPPSLGTVTAFRNKPWEGAIQPCVSYGGSGGEYFVSVKGSNQIRVRKLTGPLTNPSLAEVGSANVSTHSDPPNAPSLGSNVPLDTVDDRLMNAVYRDGSIWTTHCVNSGGRAAARWYEIAVPGNAVLQQGTVNDPSLYYFFPSIAVNAAGDVVMGFSGSNASQYVGAYFAGRKATDPAGQMSVPQQYKAGTASQENLDGFGRNRFGDYSLTSVDPSDGTFFTIQEFGRNTDVWGTWVAQLDHGGIGNCGDVLNFCITSPNSVGPGAVISNSGSASVANGDLVLEAYGCPPGQFGIFYYGGAMTAQTFGNGWRCVGAGSAGIYRFAPVQTDVFGDALQPVDYQGIPDGSGQGAIQPGDVWFFQFWYRDPPAGGAMFNLSDGLQITFCP